MTSDEIMITLGIASNAAGDVDVDAFLAPIIRAIRSQFGWPLADAELLLADARRDLVEMFDDHGGKVADAFRRELKIMLGEGDD